MDKVCPLEKLCNSTHKTFLPPTFLAQIFGGAFSSDDGGATRALDHPPGSGLKFRLEKNDDRLVKSP